MQINVSSSDCFPGFLHLLLDISMTEKHLIPSALCLWEDTSVSADTELKKKSGTKTDISNQPLLSTSKNIF